MRANRYDHKFGAWSNFRTLMLCLIGFRWKRCNECMIELRPNICYIKLPPQWIMPGEEKYDDMDKERLCFDCAQACNEDMIGTDDHIDNLSDYLP